MKKTLNRFLLSLAFLSISAQAEYQLKIPLESDRGGFLPANSIKFVDGAESEVPTSELDCRFEGASSTTIVETTYLWRSTLTENVVQLVWGGVIVHGSGGGIGIVVSNQEVLVNEYKYTRGERMTFSGPPQYVICREII